MINVLLVDGHKLVIEAIKYAFSTIQDIEVIGLANNGKEAIEFLDKNDVDVVVMDLDLPIMDGVEAAKEIARKGFSVKVLILTMHAEVRFIRELASLQVSGYLHKSASLSELIDAIRVIQAKKNHSPTEIFNLKAESDQNGTIEKSPNSLNSPDARIRPSLSARELQVFKLIARGLTTNEISEELFLSSHTVYTHHKNILSKLGIRNTRELVLYAIMNKIIT